MQELPSTLVPGASVRARAAAWRILSVEAGRSAAAVDLLGAERAVAGRRRTLLFPADELTPLPLEGRLVPLGAGSALVALRRTAGHSLPWPAPEVAVDAHLALLPHQLTPAIALRRGRATRLLLTDGVGSGKTVAAALAIADLVARRPAARVLVVVPAGLRRQWTRELLDRFGVAATTLDGGEAERATGIHDDPWTGPGVRVTSYDFVKRPEVLTATDGLSWDLVVADEAHHASRHSQRRAALHALGRRAAGVLLLTATPHDGDEEGFRALCGIGAHGPDDTVLHVGRAAAHSWRRAHRVTMPLSPEERHARDLLARYLRALREAGQPHADGIHSLLAAVLEKRAASSPYALERSVVRRRALVIAGALASPTQAPLPLDAGTEEGEGNEEWTLGLPSGLDARHERAWLGAVANAARVAGSRCHKLSRLVRLARRLREPLLVFTEYRDTLTCLYHALARLERVGILHGGQSASEQASQVDAFTAGRLRVLLATDTAAEGLNLQHACRLVVEFDQPWTPLRSEQRIGRVDRLGQTRRVHAWRFAAAHDIDARLAAAFDARRERIVAAAARLTRVGDEDEEACACLRRARRLRQPVSAPGTGRGEGAPPPHVDATATRVAWLPARRRRLVGLGPTEGLVLVEAVSATGAGEAVERVVVAVRASLAAPREPAPGPARLRALVHQATAAARRAQARRLAAVARDVAQRAEERRVRRAAVGAELARYVAHHFAQLPLFTPVGAGEPAVPALPLAAAPQTGDEDVHTVWRVPLILLPREWRAQRPRATSIPVGRSEGDTDR